MIKKLMTAVLIMYLLIGCSSETEIDCSTPEDVQLAHKTMKVNFNISVTPYENENATRTSSWEWDDGAMVYIQYHNGDKVVRGHAIYSKASDSWEASFNGAIGTADKCEIYYFDGVANDSKHDILLTENTPIYADRSAIYSVYGSELSLSAVLKPLTSRVRFKGLTGCKIHINGITTMIAYNVVDNIFSVSEDVIEATVDSSGYTPYIYTCFTDPTNRELTISNNINGHPLLFKKKFSNEVLQVGRSGFITIPTEDRNKGWSVVQPKSELTLSVSGNGVTDASFKMILVEPGTFQMGSDNGADYVFDRPAHEVTLTALYYMGETEVTQALWLAVMGQKPTDDEKFTWSSSKGIGDNYPAYYISYTDCQEFITKLNTMTGQKFRMPTEAEWEFAARGGTKSKGYTYSGSNTIGDVAWYSNNSDKTPHPVGEKQPNELGLYDMSGNVREWCADWFNSYTSGAQTNPTGPTTGTNRVSRGGDINCGNTWCTVSARDSDEPSYRGGFFVGFRLAL